MTTIEKLPEKKYLNMVFMYAASAAVYLSIAHIYSIVNPDLLLAGPVTGGLIVWVHLHTLGVITPLFMGIGFYNLAGRYNVEIKTSQIVHHFLMLYIPLPFFLFFVFHREGSPWLTISAFLIFSSAVYYIYIFVKALKKVKKENRNFEFWTDAVSLYFLFQAVLFGFALASNLSYHFFRRDITHSIKLHSHSGMAGFWLLQYFNMMYRDSRTKAENLNRYLKYAVVCSGAGIFVWTSVHDRFSWAFYFFYFCAGLTLVFLSLYRVKNKFVSLTGFIKRENSEERFLQPRHTQNLVYLFIAFAIAGIMIFYPSETFIYHNHLPFVYIYVIFYGVFVFMQMPFLVNKISSARLTSGTMALNIRRALGMYMALAILYAVCVIIEDILLMRLLQFLMLADIMYICYAIYKGWRNFNGLEQEKGRS